jgi:polyisoprenoid-binding protein YceI
MTAHLTDAFPSLPLAAGRWSLDLSHSGVSFSVRHLGLTNVRGEFDKFDATLDVGPGLDDVRVEATIDVASVDTHNADRDAHLRSTDFFDVERHPTMTFRSTSVHRVDDGYVLAGDLTIAGVVRPVAVDVEFNGHEIHPGDGKLHAGFSGTATIRRSDFGSDFGIISGAEKIMLGDKIKIELELQFIAPE